MAHKIDKFKFDDDDSLSDIEKEDLLIRCRKGRNQIIDSDSDSEDVQNFSKNIISETDSDSDELSETNSKSILVIDSDSSDVVESNFSIINDSEEIPETKHHENNNNTPCISKNSKHDNSRTILQSILQENNADKSASTSMNVQKLKNPHIPDIEFPEIAAQNKELKNVTKDKENSIFNLDKLNKIKGNLALENRNMSAKQTIHKSINELKDELKQVNNALTCNLSVLPDKGKKLQQHKANLLSLINIAEEQKQLENVSGLTQTTNPNKVEYNDLNWNEIKQAVNTVEPKYYSEKALNNYENQKSLTLERLQEFYKSLDACPGEADLEEDPKGLTVLLLKHQKRALKWLIWREQQHPRGGILADDMGLGKTLTMISLIIKSKGNENRASLQSLASASKVPNEIGTSAKYKSQATLIICPASLVQQWNGEIESKCQRGLLSVELYHGPNRETKARRIAKADAVISTYHVVLNDFTKQGPLFQIYFDRIILDEGHQIRNHKTKSSDAVCCLKGKNRWILTGTPVQNKQEDMYALLKFLKCDPFDDLHTFKRWLVDKTSATDKRFQTAISALLLRRTKTELMEKKEITPLPTRSYQLITFELEQEEKSVYAKVLSYSRTLFAQFLYERSMKNPENPEYRYKIPKEMEQEYNRIHSQFASQGGKGIRQHVILVLLLRLRQVCCHPYLINQMIEDSAFENDVEDDLLANQLEQLTINESDKTKKDIAPLLDVTANMMDLSNPVFQMERPSSKIKEVFRILNEEILLKTNNDKVIIVSQWTSFLNLLMMHFKQENWEFLELNGKVPVNKRMDIVNQFNDKNHPTRILLLSLTAGGVGLNLIGANHLLLLDLHWNPQLENQAQDRIYRMGQNKPVNIYKFMTTGTIEERIKILQDNKLEIANSILTGSKRVPNKLSLQDLKMLFEM